jgi:3-isopropylmalate dehydrogenase
MNQPYHVAVIPGDGIGPEVVDASLAVLNATGIDFDFKHYDAGDDCKTKHGVALPDETLQGALDAQAVLFGAAGNTAAEVILKLRKELNTFVNLRPSKAFDGVDCIHPKTNITIVRENTEGLYIGAENELAPGVVTATRLITQTASERIARYAFEYAQQNEYEKVTAIHKANVMKLSDGLFLDSARAIAKEFPNVEYDEQLVDSAATLMVLDPERFQVMLTPNLFGDILSDLAAGLIGGLGVCPSANLGDHSALFEPVHGTAPDIAGKGLANPTAAILCGAMMLRHFGETEAAKMIELSLEKTIAQSQSTSDLGGNLSTMEMAEAVVGHFAEFKA